MRLYLNEMIFTLEANEMSRLFFLNLLEMFKRYLVIGGVTGAKVGANIRNTPSFAAWLMISTVCQTGNHVPCPCGTNHKIGNF